MKISSRAFELNNKIPTKYTCHGDDVNPPFEFSDVPPNTKSLVLIMDDPDAPSKTWSHWIVYNIPPDTKTINEHSLPVSAVEGVNDFGTKGYGGPCPPTGSHRYFFKLYALDTMLQVPGKATKQVVEQAMFGRIIASAELTGLFQ